jgi:hypothetical protein
VSKPILCAIMVLEHGLHPGTQRGVFTLVTKRRLAHLQTAKDAKKLALYILL